MRSTATGVALAAIVLALAGQVRNPASAQTSVIAETAPASGGTYDVVQEVDPSLPDHVIFRPRDLSRFGPANPLPIVGWVNGGCVRQGTYVDLLTMLASHGYLVVAPGVAAAPSATSVAPARRPADPARALTLTERIRRIGPPQTTTAALMAGVDWAVARNAAGSGPYGGRVAVDLVALAGHSCGGMQALEGSLDPRVTTTVVLASGYWRLGGELPGINLRRDWLQRLHAPVVYLYGGSSDIVAVNAEADFYEIDQVPIFKGYQDRGHGLTLREPGGGEYGRVMLDWLDWRLKQDEDAARTFAGVTCGLCVDPAWTVEKKNIDEPASVPGPAR